MKKHFFTLTLATLTLIACKKEEQQQVEIPLEEAAVEETVVEEVMEIPDSATIAKAWENYATIGEAHNRMAKDNGIWNEDLTSWPHAGAEPMKMKMTAEIKTIYDGRYQEAIHKGEFMGMPFEGKSTLAYDNATNKYISTWIDNMSTGILVLRGNYDEATKTYTMEGENVDPVTKKMKKMREVITMVDENTQKMEMYDTGYDGKEFKNMEIIMTRKK